jgi:hypothetical protein
VHKTAPLQRRVIYQTSATWSRCRSRAGCGLSDPWYRLPVPLPHPAGSTPGQISDRSMTAANRHRGLARLRTAHGRDVYQLPALARTGCDRCRCDVASLTSALSACAREGAASRYGMATTWASSVISTTCSRCPTASMIPSACLALIIDPVKRRNLWQISSHVNGFRGEPLWGLVGRV